MSDRAYEWIETHDPDSRFGYSFVMLVSSGHRAGVRAWDRAVKDAAKWCEDQFGPENGKNDADRLDASGTWWVVSGCFRFADPTQATAFKIRWKE